MGMESFIIRKEVFTMESGDIIKCTDMEDYFIVKESLPMKGSGARTSLMDLEKFTMTNRQCLMEVLITQILITYNSNGFTMKESSKKMQSKGVER
jgi:hypothetical protein